MDIVTKSLFKEFVEANDLETIEDTLSFERFISYVVLSKNYGNIDFDLEDLSTGTAAPGVDTIAIIINSMVVNTIADIDEHLRNPEKLRVTFLLIQSKTSPKFEVAQLTNLITHTRHFFNNTDIFSTPEMEKFIELKNYIYKHSAKLKHNPNLFLYYVTTGTLKSEDKIFSSTIKLDEANLQTTNLFGKITIELWGAPEIQKYYREIKNKNSASFKFEKSIAMYAIDQNELGYIGVLPFKEFKKIILDDNGNMKPVFEENIRDYLGTKPDVNQDIAETLKTENVNAFSQLNNGITIITSTMNNTGGNVYIEDYQIVNGCQTSHVLYDNYQDIKSIDELMIPIRIIATKDENLKVNITKATNNQTAIKLEQLEGLSDFQKSLEEYYNARFQNNSPLLYERRVGQYQKQDFNIQKSQIITISIQTKAFAAMFLNEASGVSGHYGTIVRRLGKELFQRDSQSLSIYYTSSLALYKIEQLYKSGIIDKKFRRARYHILMLLAHYIQKRIAKRSKKIINLSRKEQDRISNELLEIILDDSKFNLYCQTIDQFIFSFRNITIEDRKTFERKETTDFLLKKFSELEQVLLKL